MTDRTAFGPETTTDEVLEGIDLAGTLVLITGGSSGLGAESARALAAHGAQVVVTARDLDKAGAVVERIRAATGNDAVSVEPLELDAFASVRAFADRFLDRHDRLPLLIANAGVMACPYATTADGFEQQFGTNHLGHFLLTVLLAPALVATDGARVVVLSSRGHQLSPVVFDDIGFERRPYDRWEAYGQAKTANALFAVGLDRRLAARGVRAFAVHPGVVPTDLGRHMDAADFELIRARGSRSARGMVVKSVEAGAATQVYAATAPELDGRGGLYLEDCHVAEVNDDPETVDGVRSYALDPEAADRLWSLSEDLVGASLDAGA